MGELARQQHRDAEAYHDAVEDWSQVDVERMLMERARDANRMHVELRKVARDFGEAKRDYKRIAAIVALEGRRQDLEELAAGTLPSRGPGSITETIREARVNADERVVEAAFRYATAEALRDATVESARLIRAEMSALQSVLADLRPMVSDR